MRRFAQACIWSLLISNASAQQFNAPISLACEGTISVPSEGIANAPTKTALSIDLQAQSVGGLPGSPYPITDLSEGFIHFRSALGMFAGTPAIVEGFINRLTGEAFAAATNPNDAGPSKTALFVTNLRCVPANRLF